MRDKIIIATRPGVLATAQAELIGRKLLATGVRVDYLFVSTKGDSDRLSSLDKIGGDGLFVRKIEEKLLDHEADIAVHSAKDLPFDIEEGLTIAAVPEAGDMRDMLIMRKENIENPPRIGSSSLRRIAQLKALYPDAVALNIRGNITTRLNKLDGGDFDGIVLAKAGLDRVNADLSKYDCRIFESNEMIPAACQGLIAVECREDDQEFISLLNGLSDKDSLERFTLERYAFKRLGALCSNPVGVNAEIDGDSFSMRAFYMDKRAEVSGKTDNKEQLVNELCEKLGS